MNELMQQSLFFGAVLSIGTYLLGMAIKKKTRLAVCNPLLIAIALTIAVLVLTGIDYNTYSESAKYLSYFLTPATVCLAVPLYQQLEQLKSSWKAILGGILSGVVTSLVTIFVLSMLFGLDHATYVTLLPKSITTAIGMGISEELGGYVTITVAVIVITGVFGNMIAEMVCRLFRIREPIARGIAIGSASHAIGTARAMEMGEIEGAMSSLSIAVAGLLTVVGASFFAPLL